MNIAKNIVLAIVIILVIMLTFYILLEFVPYAFDPNINVPVDWKKTATPSELFPTSGCSVIHVDEEQCLYVAGGPGQPDVMLAYRNDKLTPIHEFPKPPGALTYSVAVGDMSNNTREDLIVGRNDGIFIHYNDELGGFREVKIANHIDKEIPMAITLADYDHTGNLAIYIANYITMDKLELLKFGKTNIQKNRLLVKQTNENGLDLYVDVADQVKLTNDRNSWAAMFIDINGNGYADLVVANDEGPVDVFKNTTDGYFEKVVIPKMPQGAWMGIAVEYFNLSTPQTNNIPLQFFFTNMGTTNTPLLAMKNFIGIKGDVVKDYNPNHMLLVHKGDFVFDVVFDKNLQGPIGWGAMFHDYNLDSHEDLFVAQNMKKIIWQRLPLFRGAGGVYKWSEKKKRYTRQRIFKNRTYGITPIPMDINGNNIVDIIWVNAYDPPKAYLNHHDNPRYVNVVVPRDADYANALISLKTNKGLQYRQNILGGHGLGGSSHSQMFQFGLGKSAEPAEVTITLTNGTTKKTNVTTNDIVRAVDI